MINIAIRTEYSFRLAFGHLKRSIEACQGSAIGICDRHSTFGHVPFEKVCKKTGKKPLFGVELAFVERPHVQEKQGAQFIRFIAKNNNGLRAIYELVTKATSDEQFYYFPRIGVENIHALPRDVVVLASRPVPGLDHSAVDFRLDLSPATTRQNIEWAKTNGIELIATSDNFYPKLEDQTAYEVCIGQNSDNRTSPMHILNEWEWRLHVRASEEDKIEALKNAAALAGECEVTLPQAKLVNPNLGKTLEAMCREGITQRGYKNWTDEYESRLMRELKLIADKGFEDYFFLIADMVQYAKQHMLVGPARGSSCGSLVCYLIGITDVDPIPYELLFERFIDINRKDLPDIDIDFADDKREMVFEYLRNKYGADRVAQLGTVTRYKAKNTLIDVCKELQIPAWKVHDFKENIIEREAGDARAFNCIGDSFDTTVLGKQILEEYPTLRVAEKIEGHARQSGMHAAGILVTGEPIFNYCSFDQHTGAAQIDKYDAESLNLLKIDALGLRTLTLIQDCLDQIGWTRQQLLDYPLDDKNAYGVINNGKFSGIFQFEGYALQGLCRQFTVAEFEDIVSLTALARPGPLNSGMTTSWLRRKNGKEEVTHDHPILERLLSKYYGVIIYQESIMHVCRELGGMSWEDVTAIRKAIAKSQGGETMLKYKTQFVEGCVANNFEADKADKLWNEMAAFGAYAFNRSHSVAYSVVSYWCMLLKALFPLQYAVACLRHAKDDEQQIKLLRELVAEGYQYKAFDIDKSEENWTVKDGVIYGGFLGIKGVGAKTAKDIAKRRREGTPLTPAQTKKLQEATTPYDMLFEGHQRWGYVYENPRGYGINSPIRDIVEVTDNEEELFVVIAKITEKTVKDLNDPGEVARRNGEFIQGPTIYLNLTLEDDTGSIKASVGRFDYRDFGKKITENTKEGDWIACRVVTKKGYRKLYIKGWKKLNDMQRID